MTTQVVSPNTKLMPVSATVEDDHLIIGGCDTTELAEHFGTPLWVMDYQTITTAVDALKSGLADYPNSQVLYAGKAFLCLAMCHVVKKLGLGLDVVSEGELFTALQAGIPAENLYMHGNNKSNRELNLAVENGIKIVVDSFSELSRLNEIASILGKHAYILVRVIPGIEPDTHDHIKTGQHGSKFGIAIDDLDDFVGMAISPWIRLIGLHAHIGSQTHDLEPFLEIVDVLADLVVRVQQTYGTTIEVIDVGGGLGIAYTAEDKPLALYDWAKGMSSAVEAAFKKRLLPMPRLLLEPGRSIVGTAGVTLYTAGDVKPLPEGGNYVALDGGMADNPRPSTYNALYTAVIANRMDAPPSDTKTTLVGKYCESGDIIIKDAGIAAETGDIVAVFATGAYNYSMASNYNRTGRPACVLVDDGFAEVILERETCDDLLRQDRVPGWLLKD
jgi:diaminopimelate decarboxylase